LNYNLRYWEADLVEIAMPNDWRAVDRPTLQRVIKLPRYSRVIIALPGLSGDTSEALQRDVNRLLSECGCGMATGFLLAVVPICIAFDVFEWTALSARPIQTSFGNLLVFVMAICLGKAIGRARAKWKLRRLLQQIETRIPAVVI
jgi:hypothetical protein